MVGGKFNKIFDGRRCLGEEEMRASLVSGGAVALGELLRDKHGWNGTSLLAAPILTLEAGSVVDTNWAVWIFFFSIPMFMTLLQSHGN